MEIRQTLLVTLSYVRYFFLRRDWFLFAFMTTVGIYSVTFVGAFVMLFHGLSDFMGPNVGSISTGVWFLPALESHVAMNIGVMLLGISAVASLASAYFATHTAGAFGAFLVMRFQPVWDTLDMKQKTALIQTGKSATTYGRLVMVSVVPLTVFAAGIVYLALFNLYLALGVLTLGGVALFVFIPADNVTTKLTKNKFNIDIDGAQLLDQRQGLRTFMAQRLEMFMARRLISSLNVAILFIVIAIAFFLLGPERVVSLFNEQTVVVIVVLRSSMMSLTRVTICLRMARQQLPALLNVQAICREGKLPLVDATMKNVDDEDEEI